MLREPTPHIFNDVSEEVERIKLTYGIAGAPCYSKLLDEKLIHQFCKLIKQGLGFDGCCDFLGVDKSSFHRWKRQGEEYLDCEEGQRDPSHAMYAHFFLQTREASAAYRLRVTRRAHDPFNKTRKVDLLILERRDRKTYSKNDPMGGFEETEDPDDRFL